MNSKTRFFRHYKNKPYKYLGTARHSETLEELALYETLYKNDLGSIWVRPKDMFFENVEIDGKLRPRFEKINFTFRSSDSFTENDLAAVQALCLEAFGNNIPNGLFLSKVKAHRKLHYQTAFDGENLIGFKLGFARDDLTFYSWTGAVKPAFQGLGVAGELMLRQHNWCRENGFKKIQTRSYNQFTAMIRLNLKFGFLIIGTQAEAGSGIKIIFEKELT